MSEDESREWYVTEIYREATTKSRWLLFYVRGRGSHEDASAPSAAAPPRDIKGFIIS